MLILVTPLCHWRSILLLCTWKKRGTETTEHRGLILCDHLSPVWFLALLESENSKLERLESKIGPSLCKLEGNNMILDILASPGSAARNWGSFCVPHQPLVCPGTTALLLSVEDTEFKYQGQAGHHAALHQGPGIALIHSLSWGQSVPQESLLCSALAFSSTYIVMWKTLGRCKQAWCAGGCMLDTPGSY